MTACNIIDKELAKALMPQRPKDSCKGTFGSVLNFSGCKEYIGAAYLSSIAPLKVGAGLVDLATPNCVKDKVASICPDIIYTDVSSFAYLEAVPQNIDFSKYKAIIVGCGLGNNKCTQKFIKKFTTIAQELDAKIIYDADALNIIAETGITQLGKNAIITPHPGELSRLLGKDIDDIQANRQECALEAAAKFHAVTVLKGYNTVIASPERNVFIDISGTNALAKAGMGDVLSGIISGLCAQGLNTKQASVLGVYIHSQAGILGAEDKTNYGLCASDLINYISKGIKSIIS